MFIALTDNRFLNAEAIKFIKFNGPLAIVLYLHGGDEAFTGDDAEILLNFFKAQAQKFTTDDLTKRLAKGLTDGTGSVRS